MSILVEDDAVVGGEELVGCVTVQPDHFAVVPVAVNVLDWLPLDFPRSDIEG